MRVLKDSVAVLAQRNEGAFLVEWVAWYRMLGFDNLLVMHNDCTDHSPQLLRLLERAGVLTQKKHLPPPGKAPQPAAHVLATRHPLVQEASWVFVCDTDEFLVVHEGDGSVAALADAMAGRAMGMSINWRIFGSSDVARWEDGLVHRRFLRSGTVRARQNSCYKTLFCDPKAFDKLRSHSPQGWLGDGTWGKETRRFWLADGTTWDEYHPSRAPRNATPHGRMTNTMAQVNHYAVQSHEQFAYKKGRASAAGLKDRYTDTFFGRFDRNEQDNPVALDYAAAFDPVHAEIMAIPGVARLHHLCCADYVGLMCEKRGDDPAADPRYQHHMAEARRLPRHG